MEAIIKKAMSGDSEAMTALYSNSKGAVMCLCQALLLDDDAASKATIHIFEKAIDDIAYGHIESESQLQHSLIRRAVMHCKAKIQRADDKAFCDFADTKITVPKDLENTRFWDESIQAVLENLSPIHRFLYVMDALDEYREEEIAGVFNMTPDEVSQILQAEDAHIKHILTTIRLRETVSVIGKTLFKQMYKKSPLGFVVPDCVDDAVIKYTEKVCQPLRARKKTRDAWRGAGIAAVLITLCVLALSMRPEAPDPNVDLTNARPTEAVEVTETVPEATEAPTAQEAEMVEGCYADISIAGYGTITVLLDGNAAPETVQNFVKLANSGFYNGLTFHRIIEGFMMQGGDPNGDGTGGSEETITGEFAINGIENELSHIRGAISMARSSDYNSASSQFFIVHEDSTFLDGQYAAFGYVTDGMEIVDVICENVEPTDSNGSIAHDTQPVITSITIREVTENESVDMG